MSESHALEGPDQRNAEHELWLSMQAAYTKYRNASSELGLAATQPSSAIPSAEENLRIETATSEERTAFENYVEARMQYAEFQCDQNTARSRSSGRSKTVEDSTGPSEDKSPRRYWAGSTISRPALASVVVVLLAVSLAYAMLAWGFVRGASTVRDEIGATLNQARSDIQALGRKIDAVHVAQQFVIRASATAPTAPVRQQRTSVAKAAERKSNGNRRWRRIRTPLSGTQKRSNVAGTQKKLIHSVSNLGGRSYWTFILPVSRQFEVVGPLRLSLRSVNLKGKYFDLCVMANELKLEHVNLREPVSMAPSDPSRRLELVATRIDKNHVQGYLRELKYRKSHLTASQPLQRPSGGS